MYRFASFSSTCKDCQKNVLSTATDKLSLVVEWQERLLWNGRYPTICTTCPLWTYFVYLQLMVTHYVNMYSAMCKWEIHPKLNWCPNCAICILLHDAVTPEHCANVRFMYNGSKVTLYADLLAFARQKCVAFVLVISHRWAKQRLQLQLALPQVPRDLQELDRHSVVSSKELNKLRSLSFCHSPNKLVDSFGGSG